MGFEESGIYSANLSEIAKKELSRKEPRRRAKKRKEGFMIYDLGFEESGIFSANLWGISANLSVTAKESYHAKIREEEQRDAKKDL